MTDLVPRASTVSVVRLTGSLGAEVQGLDLAADLDDATVAEVRALLLAHRVLFFRAQHLDPTAQVRFGRRFGELTPAHPLVGGLDEAHPEVLLLDSRDYPLGVGTKTDGTSYNNRWHTDVTFSERPPLGSILTAQVIPPRGGDTLWADLVDAYRTLSEPIRGAIDGLWASHDASRAFPRGRGGELPPVRHPVVRVHPETAERSLFVNPVFTSRIEGLSDRESEVVLGLLYEHSTQPERVVRWRWQEGDVAFWDNRVTSHYAAADYGDEHRRMHRITLRGDRPYGTESQS